MARKGTARRTGAAVLALLALASATFAQPRADAGRGSDLAVRLCAGCHVIDGGAPGAGPRGDVPSFRAIANRAGRTPESVRAAIMAPHPPMPSIPLTLAEINDLTAYILSLK